MRVGDRWRAHVLCIHSTDDRFKHRWQSWMGTHQIDGAIIMITWDEERQLLLGQRWGSFVARHWNVNACVSHKTILANLVLQAEVAVGYHVPTRGVATSLSLCHAAWCVMLSLIFRGVVLVLDGLPQFIIWQLPCGKETSKVPGRRKR